MRDPKERLLDIRQCIEKIEKYSAKGRAEFDRDELLRNWIVHHLLVIGEAARNLPADVRAREPEIPWLEIVGMRHVLVHNYFEIDVDIVWGVVEKDLPKLKDAIGRLLAGQSNG